jgi:hypothetical protein
MPTTSALAAFAGAMRDALRAAPGARYRFGCIGPNVDHADRREPGPSPSTRAAHLLDNHQHGKERHDQRRQNQPVGAGA